jgi:hypothetical protein
MNVRLIITECDDIHPYLSRIADIAGGFTSWQGVGGWKDSHGQLEVEPVTIVDCTYDELYRSEGETEDCFRDIARDIARDLNQDCVYLAIDGEVEYVKA